MRNTVIGFTLSALLLALCASTEAQQRAKVAKIGWLGASSLSGPGSGFGLFRREFHKIGYVEGKNVTFEHRFADDKLELLPALVDDLVRVKVDVILTASTSGAQAAKNATRTIPIVFLNASDPVAAGLVDSLARPGANITGLTNLAPDLGGKRLELLKEIIPKLSRVAVLWNPQELGSAQQWNESQLPARELRLALYSMEVSRADKYESAFKEATKARSGALAVTQHILASSNRKQIADLAIKNRLPAIWPRGDYVASDGFISYGPDREEPFRRAASMVDKILKGTKPADIPVEQPTKFELVINLKTAKQIGLTIPPNVLARADRVIR
jgi:putative tryptophan/tyrosine transport system substrate-binding protein